MADESEPDIVLLPGTDADDFDALVDGLRAIGERAENFERGLGHLREMRRRFDEPHARPHTADQPCSHCRTYAAVRVVKGNQTTVRCWSCQRLIERTFRPRGDAVPDDPQPGRPIDGAQRARILARDSRRCVLCGSVGLLVVGHLLSVVDGLALGASETELDSDANLATMCRPCRDGLAAGQLSVPARTYAAIMWRVIQAEIDPGGCAKE